MYRRDSRVFSRLNNIPVIVTLAFPAKDVNNSEIFRVLSKHYPVEPLKEHPNIMCMHVNVDEIPKSLWNKKLLFHSRLEYVKCITDAMENNDEYECKAIIEDFNDQVNHIIHAKELFDQLENTEDSFREDFARVHQAHELVKDINFIGKTTDVISACLKLESFPLTDLHRGTYGEYVSRYIRRWKDHLLTYNGVDVASTLGYLNDELEKYPETETLFDYGRPDSYNIRMIEWRRDLNDRVSVFQNAIDKPFENYNLSIHTDAIHSYLLNPKSTDAIYNVLSAYMACEISDIDDFCSCIHGMILTDTTKAIVQYLHHYYGNKTLIHISKLFGFEKATQLCASIGTTSSNEYSN